MPHTVLKMAVVLLNYTLYSDFKFLFLSAWVPLHEAASRGFVDVALVLLSLGAPTRPRTIDNLTPALLARANKHFKCEDLLGKYFFLEA